LPFLHFSPASVLSCTFLLSFPFLFFSFLFFTGRLHFFL
jgi:hypothetical protein